MQHLLKVGLLLAMGFNLGLLLIRCFGAPGDDALAEEAAGRFDGRSGSPR